jgi:CheY-like chemotaxis protein
MADDANADTNCRRPQCRVLLVEEDVADRRRLTSLLEVRGYTVHATRDGDEALDYLHSFPPPAVILLDVAAPAAGGAAFRRAQRDDPALATIPVIALAPAGAPVPSAGALGDVGYLRKPVRGEALFNALSAFTPPKPPEVLLVEDEPAILRMLELMLTHHGFSVREANGGSEAITIFEKHRGTIDVVLLDVQMPEIDGPQTLTVLRALDPEVAVIFMSGNTGDYSTEELLHRGARYVLQKPFRSMAELMRLLYQVSHRPDRPTIARLSPPGLDGEPQ